LPVIPRDTAIIEVMTAMNSKYESS
jgi:hypothetical protein